MPVILYYLLKDGNKIIPSITRLFPTRSQHKISVMLHEMNQQVSSYYSWPNLSCDLCRDYFSIGYSIIGLPYGVTIGMIAGLLVIIPYYWFDYRIDYCNDYCLCYKPCYCFTSTNCNLWLSVDWKSFTSTINSWIITQDASSNDFSNLTSCW